MTESIDKVREEFLETVLEGFTKEELETYSSFFQRLFKNTKNAMEGNSRALRIKNRVQKGTQIKDFFGRSRWDGCFLSWRCLQWRPS